jgi:hypothetical protein
MGTEDSTLLPLHDRLVTLLRSHRTSHDDAACGSECMNDDEELAHTIAALFQTEQPKDAATVDKAKYDALNVATEHTPQSSPLKGVVPLCMDCGLDHSGPCDRG